MKGLRLAGYALAARLLAAPPLCGQPAPVSAPPPDGRPTLQPPAEFVRAEDRARWSAPVICPNYGDVPGLAIDADGNPYIANIQQFLDTCPQRDPNLQEIRGDFRIRQDDVAVSTFPCTEPVSQMAVADYTDSLIVLQGLRTMYYMDRGQTGHLPWTSGTLYDWMKAEIQGIDVVTGVVGGYCCTTIGGRTYFVSGTQDDFNREFDKTWEGISGNIAFYAHERRHLDGNGFPHSSCCGIAFGCDDNYDPDNLSPYGVQWWLDKAWLEGEINVGVGCLSPDLIAQAANWHISGANYQYRDRFCDTKPPLLSVPAVPCGPCNPRECTCPTITVSPATLSPGIVGADYSEVLTAGGGTPPYAWTVASGSLPPGLSLSEDGVLAGRPTATGVFGFTVSVQDAASCGASPQYTLTVAHAVRRRVKHLP